MSRASDLGPAKVNAVLTSIVAGYKEPSFSADMIAPVVYVENDTGKVRTYNKDYFKQYATARALRAESVRLNLTGSTLVAYALKQYSIEVPIDDKEYRLSDDLNLQTVAAKRATAAIQMDTEIELATLLQATGTYSGSMHTTLTSGNELNDVDIDPIAVLNGYKNSIRAKIARNPNTLVLSPDTERAILMHPLVVARLGNADIKILTREQLAKMLQFENIIVPEGVYNASGTLTDIYSEMAGLYYIAPVAEQNSENPSFIYTLRLKGQNPVIIKEYRDDSIQSDVFQANADQQFFVAMQDAGFLIKNTLA